MNFHISKICVSLSQMQMNCITLRKLKKSFMFVNSIYFLSPHIFLFIAILNQKGMQRGLNNWANSKSVSEATRP